MGIRVVVHRSDCHVYHYVAAHVPHVGYRLNLLGVVNGGGGSIRVKRNVSVSI